MACKLCYAKTDNQVIICNYCALQLNIATEEQIFSLINKLNSKNLSGKIEHIKRFLGNKMTINELKGVKNERKTYKTRSNLVRKRPSRTAGLARHQIRA